MKVFIRIDGVTQLILHNIRLSDPIDQFKVAIEEITKKKTKTTADQIEIAKLEFMGGLYTGHGPLAGRVIMPAPVLHRCFVSAAKASREGKSMERALLITTQEFPLRFPGEKKSLEQLWDDENHHFRAAVRVKANRVMRMRPRFPEWRVDAEFELVEQMMNFGVLKDIIVRAGVSEGLCDHRTKGSGRFNAIVSTTPIAD